MPLARSRRPSALLFLVLAVGACAGLDPDPRPRPVIEAARTLTAEDIERSNARTAWDALRLWRGVLRLGAEPRPGRSRITHRGSSLRATSGPLVFLDGVRVREVDLLRYLSARSLETIEWIDGPEATTHFGTGAADGVVRIRTKRGGRR